jgi:hypothetical protein
MTADPLVDATQDPFDAELITFGMAPAEPPQGGATALCGAPPEGDPVLAAYQSLAGPPGEDPGPGAAARLAYAAAVTRPMDEVAQFIALLGESPGCEEIALDALRTAAVSRPVDDVSELVALLGEPPHRPDAADEAVRTASMHRPIGDVTRLVVLLNAPPHRPGALEEAVHAAAATRPVEELAVLVEQLQDNGVVWQEEPPYAEHADPHAAPLGHQPMDGMDADDDTQPRRRWKLLG